MLDDARGLRTEVLRLQRELAQLFAETRLAETALHAIVRALCKASPPSWADTRAALERMEDPLAIELAKKICSITGADREALGLPPLEPGWRQA